MTLCTVVDAIVDGVGEVDAYLLCLRLVYAGRAGGGLGAGGGGKYIYVAGFIGA
jgi:hypothetical protein